MPDLLLELFSEEIPARMQAQAAKDLERLVVGALSDRGLLFEGAKAKLNGPSPPPFGSSVRNSLLGMIRSLEPQTSGAR